MEGTAEQEEAGGSYVTAQPGARVMVQSAACDGGGSEGGGFGGDMGV